MANSENRVDFSRSLADFLAASVDNGIYADVIEATKVDKPTEPVAATETFRFGGQLWANLIDDFFKVVWEVNQGRANYTLHTSGESSAIQELITLGEGELADLVVRVRAMTVTAGEVAFQRLQGQFYRAGTTKVLAMHAGPTYDEGLAGVGAVLTIASDAVRVVVTGVAAKDVTWSVRVEFVERISP